MCSDLHGKYVPVVHLTGSCHAQKVSVISSSSVYGNTNFPLNMNYDKKNDQ